jgi:hypothetical protein
MGLVQYWMRGFLINCREYMEWWHSTELHVNMAVVRELVMTLLHATIHDNVEPISSTPKHQPPRQSRSSHRSMLYT